MSSLNKRKETFWGGQSKTPELDGKIIKAQLIPGVVFLFMKNFLNSPTTKILTITKRSPFKCNI